MAPSESLHAESDRIRNEAGLPPVAEGEEGKNVSSKIKRQDDDYKRRWQGR